jgi:hypothetical protein
VKSVLIMSFSRLTRDPRVLRQIRALAADYEVHTVGYGEAPDGVATHVRVPDELQGWRENYRAYYALVLARRFSRLYFGASWVRYVTDRIAPGSFDVILANDVNAVPLAVRLAPRDGVHADLHEFATRQSEEDRVWNRYAKPVYTWAVQRFVTQADSVTTVSPGLASAYRSEFGIDAGVVPNATPYRADIQPHPTPADGPVRIVHAGVAGRSRRLEIMVDAVLEANAARPGAFSFDIFLVPGDRAYIEELTRRADAGGGAVRVLPPVAFDQLVPTLSRYDVGLYALPPLNFNQKHALPNKIFEFVQARLAIVIGPSADMRLLVEEHGLGAVADGFAPTDIATSLLGLTPERVDGMKAASDAAALPLSSEEQSSQWKAAVDRIAQGAGSER